MGLMSRVPQAWLATLQPQPTPFQWIQLLVSAVVIYASTRCIYLLWFHPASKFPGPRLAAVSNAMMKRYGDVVRIAPNELDDPLNIYGSAVRNHETFLKTSFMDLGTGDGGITWEQDPIKHRITAKKVSLAFPSKSMKAKEFVLHSYIDLFVRRMRELGNTGDGVDLRTWTSWLAMDISADMTYGRKMHHMRDMKTSDFLEAIIGTNIFGTVNQISKKFPLLIPLMLLFIPPRILKTLPRVVKINKQEIQRRIDERSSTRHLDYFETLIPANSDVVTGKERTHLEQVAAQLLVAGYDPISDQFYGSLFQLLKNPDILKTLTEEIRHSFHSYDEIVPDALLQLKYLHACLMESFRIVDTLLSGLPRISPGASVDGVYVEKGVVCQTSFFTTLRSDRYFHDPLQYHPQRWLVPEHPKYEQRFSQDNLKSMFPFLLGPRMCPGRESAWIQIRLFLAKVLWTFDLELVKGHHLSFDRDFSVFTMWNKPEMRVRFIPASGLKE
ncbi:isotrichodermin C-15 hydroxylase [Xylaria sp. FL0064]|nr:isotrichodermin C-15 hydroxylase [Xylaria sp. FL0064]